jgi:transcriptional regulator with XRE-family HTH domain
MKHTAQKQMAGATMGLNRDLLASYMRNKMANEKLSLRKAAEIAGCSPATFSRLLGGQDSGYMPDTATLGAIAKWLKKDLSDFEGTKLAPTKSLEDVAVHLHALPDLAHEDAQFIMSVVRLLYDNKRKPATKRE